MYASQDQVREVHGGRDRMMRVDTKISPDPPLTCNDIILDF